jgi:putative phosphoribosyl transferase
MVFADRQEAGQRLAALLHGYAGKDAVVFGVPRGGVVVAAEVANALDLPLDVFVLRKLGVPGHEELAFGAIASGGVRFIDAKAVAVLGLSVAAIESVTLAETTELARRKNAYRGSRPPLDVRGKVVLLVDDGIATGASILAGVTALRQGRPDKIIVAVPVAPRSAVEYLQHHADEVVCVQVPSRFYGVGQFYQDFSQITDETVLSLLQQADTKASAGR